MSREERRFVAWSVLLGSTLLLFAGDLVYLLGDVIGFPHAATAAAVAVGVGHLIAALWVARGPTEVRPVGRRIFRVGAVAGIVFDAIATAVEPPIWALLAFCTLLMGLAFGVWAADTRGWAIAADARTGGSRRLTTATNVMNVAGLLSGAVLGAAVLVAHFTHVSAHELVLGGIVVLACAAALALPRPTNRSP